jgi:hypothetical protein
VVKGKYYKCLTLAITNDNNSSGNGVSDRERKVNKQDDEIDPDDPHLNEHLIRKDNNNNTNDNIMNIYPELLKCYQEKKNTIIFTWISNQKQQTPSHNNNNTNQQQQQVNGFFILDIPELFPTPSLPIELTQPFLQTLIENICNITPILKPLSTTTTLIILNITINYEALLPFNNTITSFETFIHNNSLPLTWIGPTKYTHPLTNHPTINHTINFICQTSLKGLIPLNNIGIAFQFSTPKYTSLSTTTFKPKYIEIHI